LDLSEKSQHSIDIEDKMDLFLKKLKKTQDKEEEKEIEVQLKQNEFK
jgi:hypothetical protein